jgi:hypothetical protein
MNMGIDLQVIKKMNIDGRAMAEVKFGKPLILLMKRDESSILSLWVC